MDVWNLVLYVVATLLALKSLASLMTHHKKVVVQQLAIEYTQELSQPGNHATEKNPSELPTERNPADKKASAA
ncbi:MAG: hypothetical protein KDA70_21790 [Planctomycetaceae bacterium]|nr:hypothetical protein [Planctomycetaceae bacterium]